MIEVIYDKNKDKSSGDDNINENKPKSESVKLPKNIRQIGTPSLNKRIYIEDYVVTYLNYISRPGSTSARGAILLGETKRLDIGDVIFISGAVDAENLEFDMDESEFTQEVWTGIYDQVKEFFPELSVVGWFLSRMGFSTAINEKIEKMHVENFPGKDKVLYVTDSLENEDAFYMYERGQLVKQKGYYVYYTKNEAMQNYIIKKKGGIPSEQNTEIHRKDEELIRSYREKNTSRKPSVRSQNISLAYVAGTFLVMGMLVMGVTIVSNNDRMKEMEVTLNRLELTAEVTTATELADAMSNNNQVASPADVIHNNTSQAADNTTTEDIVNDGNTEQAISVNTDNNGDGQEDISTEQTLPVSTGGNPTYYTIKLGDSLGSIALEYYGSILYAEDIAEANNIDINDKIYEGQNIILPSISVED